MMRRMTGTIRYVNMQLMLLMTTLPVEMKGRLQSILGCEYMQVMRRRGERLELKYKVSTLMEVKERENLDHEVAKILQSKSINFGENDRTIVYYLK